jgi:hypothetical protein
MGENYGVKAKTKGNNKLNNRQRNQLLTHASKQESSLSQIIADLDLPIKKRHKCNILRASGNFKCTKIQ